MQVSVIHDGPIDCTGFGKRFDPELALQHVDAALVLLQRARPVAGQQVQHHELPVYVFGKLVHSQVAAGVEDGPVVVGLAGFQVDDRRQRVEVEALIERSLRYRPSCRTRGTPGARSRT